MTELAQPFLETMSLPAVTKHLKVLERAGLITKSRDAQFRPCRLNATPLRDANDWMEQYRVYWEESLDRLDAYLKGQGHGRGAKKPNRTKQRRRETGAA